ncbi:FG-GAP repeat protein [Streptomyces amakusaensis]|uniref:FG-GAP-like repeat-containing protein n=1 Tax=Streptomyces amakusaensis TaxID=67271 RepID=A0ABW0AJH7_9ACTN
MNTRSTTRGLGLLTALAAISTLTAPVALAAPTPVPAAPSAPSAPTAAKDDFNGDGYADLVVGVPEGRVAFADRAGFVTVSYGSKSGLKPSGTKLLTQGGQYDTARFGAALTSADLNRDGYTDLVIGAPGLSWYEDEGGLGETMVAWGSAQGLPDRGHLLATIDDSGSRLLTADFDGDGNPDLVSVDRSKKNLRVLHGPFDTAAKPARESSVPMPHGTKEGEWDHFDLQAGDVNGDGIADLVSRYRSVNEKRRLNVELILWKGAAGGLSPYQKVTDHRRQPIWGDTLAIGDVNNDGRDDIAVGRTYDSTSGGKVTYIEGTAEGRIGSRNKVFRLDSPRVAGTPERFARFGVSVSIGDLDGDTYGEIVVGADGMTLGGKKEAGSVITLPGTKNGPTSTGSEELHQNTKGVPGTAEAGDRFGTRTKILDADGDGRGELVVGTPGEDGNRGAIWVFKTDKNGVTAKGSFALRSDSFDEESGSIQYGQVYTP